MEKDDRHCQPIISKFFQKQNTSIKKRKCEADVFEDTNGSSSKRKQLDEPVLHTDHETNKSPATVICQNTLTKLQKFDISRKFDSKSNVESTSKDRFVSAINDSNERHKHCISNNISSSSGSPVKENDYEISTFQKFQRNTATPKPSAKKSPNNREPISHTAAKENTSIKYTPLEQQFVNIKTENPEIMLFVECGYKYRFFGTDAEIASKELNIYCHQDHNFMTASIPSHRLNVHVSRLVSKGYKVGVVKQMETAALKAAGENRSAPFTRQLTNVYTKSTFIDGCLEETTEDASTGGHLLCIYDEGMVQGSLLRSIAIISVDLANGEIIYDHFSDNKSCFELETRLTHINPLEVLVSKNVEECVSELLTVYRHKVDLRVEKVSDANFHSMDAPSYVRSCYENMSASLETVKEILSLPHSVLCCLSALLLHLEEFGLSQVLKLNSSLRKFSMFEKHMQLCGRTLKNLEIFHNCLDGKKDGSLFWLLDQTKSQFGSKRMKNWLAHPLLQLRDIEERQEAITEILEEGTMTEVENLLKLLPNLERGLTLIFYRKCSPQDFLSVCEALRSTKKVFDNYKLNHKSHLLNTIKNEIPVFLSGIEKWISTLSRDAAKHRKMTELFADDTEFPDIRMEKDLIEKILLELQSHKKEIRLLLKSPALEYISILGTEFLVEVKNTNLKLVPQDWIKVNATKSVTRFHTPFIIETFKKLSQHRETLLSVCSKAWQDFLGSFEKEYAKYKKAVIHLATLDCIIALAKVAKQYDYCKPELLEENGTIDISQGRHPVVNVLLDQYSQQYVANDTQLQSGGKRCMIVTGPNMGGKSSYIKQVALITLMAQMGSYVPATSARISIVDAIHTRMGASDDLFKGRSTFMTELSEASEIISKATERSLVILDELGRGTSTHDGVAIADATLNYFIKEVKCLTLFVTHYPTLVEVEKTFPNVVANYHMSFYVQDEDDDQNDDVESLVFLYQLVPGIAHRSYGLNVARLASIPQDILNKAAHKSKELEEIVARRRKEEHIFRSIINGEMARTEVTEKIDWVSCGTTL